MCEKHRHLMPWVTIALLAVGLGSCGPEQRVNTVLGSRMSMSAVATDVPWAVRMDIENLLTDVSSLRTEIGELRTRIAAIEAGVRLREPPPAGGG